MEWISLITKMKKQLILSSLVLLTSCSQKVKRAEVKKPAKKVKAVISGPSLKNNDGSFVDVTEKLGLKGEKAVHLYSVDLNNDGFSDLVTLPDFYSVPKFFIFDKSKKKYNKIKNFPAKQAFYASYLNFADFNSDGVVDMVVGTLNQKSELTKRHLQLYKGSLSKGKVHFSLAGSGLKDKKVKPTSSIVLLDYNLDGKLDIFESNWYDQKKGKIELVPDRLLMGKEFSFKDVSYLLKDEKKYNRSLKKYVEARPSFGASTCDVDGNGYPDILTSTSSGFKNRLWLNLFDSKHKDRIYKDFGKESSYGQDNFGELTVRGGGDSYYSLCTDYNNDSFIDILVGELSHSYSPEEKDRSSFLTGKHDNFPPEFIRTEYTQDAGQENWTQSDRRGVWLDYNNDGLIDVLVENSGFPPLTRLILFEQFEDHAYDDVGKQHGLDILNPSGTITVDFNKDGRMDIISGQTRLRNSRIKNRIYAFENKTNVKGNRAVRFFLNGKKANKDGLGSTVELMTTTGQQKRWYELNSGSLPSQNEKGLHFGVPRTSKLIEANVSWPVLKNKRPLKVKYKLSKFKLKKYSEFTLCENGKVKRGRLAKCN